MKVTQSPTEATPMISSGVVPSSIAKHTIYSAIGTTRSNLSPEEKERQQKQLMKKRERVVLAIGLATCVVSLITLILVDSTIVGVAMLFSVICSTTVMLRQRKLTSKGSVRNLINVLRQSANEYHGSNSSLRKSIDSLLPQAARVKEMEQQVEDQVRKSGQNMNEFTNSISLNNALLDKMKEKMKLQTSQEILRVFFLSDRSKNMKLDPTEVEILIVRLSVMNGVIFDEGLFRKTFRNGLTLSDISILIKAMYNDNDDSDVGDILEMNPLEVITLNRLD